MQLRLSRFECMLRHDALRGACGLLPLLFVVSLHRQLPLAPPLLLLLLLLLLLILLTQLAMIWLPLDHFL